MMEDCSIGLVGLILIMEDCSIGLHEQSDCLKLSYTKRSGIILATDFSTEDQKLLMLRTDLNEHQLQTVCFHHKLIFLNRYELIQNI